MLRQMTDADVAGATLLIEEFLSQSPTYRTLDFSAGKTFRQAQELLADEDAFCWVDDCDGQIVGVLAGAIRELPFTMDLVAQDYAFYFAAGHRGQSAIILIRKFRDWAIAKGARLIMTGITAGLQNDRVTRLYQRLGFRLAGNVMIMEV